MTLTKRISELLTALNTGIPERESCFQLGFLAAVCGEPFYLFGRSGSGKNLLAERLANAFKNAKILKVGRRQQAFPNNLASFDVIIFQNFNPLDDETKDNIKIALSDRENAPLIITSDQRPEVTLSRADIVDRVTLSISLPESLSSAALCDLLQNQSKLEDFHVPMGIAIAPEEAKAWCSEIKKVTLSTDTLCIIGKMAELCDKEGIYVSIRKWIALTNMVKAIAFFNERTETKFTDALFLGTSIWGKSSSNATISANFNEIVKAQIMKDIPDLLGEPYDALRLYKNVKRLLHSSCNLYETKIFNNEPCLSYRVTIAGEPTPLYVPLRYMESDEDFNPFNEFRKVETRVRCNYHGTSSCTISIDSSVKGIGLRSSISTNTLSNKFEDFATLPSYILKENDPEIHQQKLVQLEECKAEAKTQLEKKTKDMLALKELFMANKQAREDLFCNKELFDQIQGEIRHIFDNAIAVANKLKETLELFDKKG
ncbi:MULTISPECIES: hypothetical protein [unclassified Fibrobacter]|uniref:hypothetical protein n=1 Tax=unclassified Fibrobacter TaxID=2634177 RepID=UPI000D6B4DB2|nr:MULTISPECIES: hypothetical protein [unclassified Fibrobacter]PWJ70064.1 MoxR-like ATPase [Fibrobacter sp. UWR4]PZW73412.1 MoxR-like ATPase [Fibrobacter sp. UWR1]